MNDRKQKRLRLNALLVAAMLIGNIAALIVLPEQSHAAVSADPSEEIVYIDGNGFIRVLDTQGEPRVGWASDDSQIPAEYRGEWKDIDLGDVNGDGDLEIVAIGRDTSGRVKVGVFDPVVASGQVDPNRKINGIPWNCLVPRNCVQGEQNEITFAGNPELIASGDFDANIPGDEILVGYQESNAVFKVKILNAQKLEQNGKPSGSDWKEHLSVDFDHPWTYVDDGQIDGVGSAEVVLIDGDSAETAMDVFSIDGGFVRIDGKHSDGDRWRRVAVGRIINQTGEKLDIAGIRSSSRPDNASILVYTLDSDNELSSDGDWQWAFAPQPEFVFLADLSGNGDKEILFLRKHPSEKGPRLIMRDDWGDDKKNHPDIELALDEDDGYRIGAGGDVDGDGRDEIIVARDNNIRVYRDPHRSVDSNTISNYAESTNRESLKVGDLDKNPFVEGPQFGSDKTKVEATTPIGTQSGTSTVQILNISSGENVPFTVRQGLPSWINVDPMFGATPTTIRITFDAADLTAGTHTAQLILDSTSNVTNKPYAIELVLTVTAAALSASPPDANFLYFPCAADDMPERSITLDIGGTAGLSFRSAVVEIPYLEAAQAGLSGPAVSGIVDQAGNIVVTDEVGNAAMISMAGVDLATDSTNVIHWPEDIDWMTGATSITSTVPATLTLTVSPTSVHGTANLPVRPNFATLILVADARAGAPPDNVFVVPVSVLCVHELGHIRAPIIGRH